MKGEKLYFFLLSYLLVLTILACASQPKPSLLLREMENPPQVIQKVFTKEGKSDYVLIRDEGYPFRLVYLCENRVYNFIDEPDKNPVLVSVQPVLDTEVEKKLPADDRKIIWTCLEVKVREEQARTEEQKKNLTEERKRLEKELSAVLIERDQIVAEIELKKKLAEQKQRLIEEEMRKAEEERLRKLEEEQRRKSEEERKVKAYRAGEKEKEEPQPIPPQVTESGIFLVMKEADAHEEPQKTSKIQAKLKKYDIFEVINSRKDEQGTYWYQVILSERLISKKGKKIGWTPEEKIFWVKNKLLVWVYPGDLAKIDSLKPLKLNVEELQFTGKKVSPPQKPPFFEVIYEVNIDHTEKLIGWVAAQDGIRREDKNTEEMMDILKNLAKTRWPLKIHNDILRGYIRMGFTPEQVILSWGRPEHVNTTRTLMGVHEQWVYGEKPFPRAYVYFENGLLKSWEFLKRDRDISR